jgi:hypothetical protein
MFVGRSVNCPECQAQIEISRAGEVRQVAAMSAGATMKSIEAGTFPTDGDSDAVPLARRGGAVSARTVAWGAASLMAIVGLGMAWWNRADRTVGAPSAVAPAVVDKVAPAGAGKADPEAGSPPVRVPDVSPPSRGTVLERRLEGLGRRISEPTREQEVFPGALGSDALAPGERLGWLARVFAASGPAPHPELSWKDPLNEGFVRRRMDELLNPAVSAMVGPDGYPSTHFVGNAGFGRGARRLAADDSRAGPFGLERVTRWSDARDGLSQTILVFGLNEPAGGWASHGDATLRELTREPFVNGPDGLGTGQKDSMLVLMADGSVRTLARDIDPMVMRGLVAMSDHSMPDMPTPESGTGEAPQVAATAPAENPSPAKPLANPPGREVAQGTLPDAADLAAPPVVDNPVEPAKVPAKSRNEVVTALSRRVVRYEARGERGKLAKELADFAGVPVLKNTGDEASVKRGLAESTTLKSGPVSVGDLIQRLLAPAGLEALPVDGGIEIHPLDANR